MTSHFRLSWFSNTGIDVRFSLKGILLTWFLSFFGCSTLPSFPFSLPVLTSLADHYCLLHLLFWDEITTSQPQGRALPKAFSSSPTCKEPAHIHAHYGAILDSFMDSLLPALRLPCPSAVFLGTIHETRRNFYIEVAPSLGNISPYAHPSKRSTASIIAPSTWNVVTSPHFLTKHSLCLCPRVEWALPALPCGPLSPAFVMLIFMSLEESCVFCCYDALLPGKGNLLYLWYICSSAFSFLGNSKSVISFVVLSLSMLLVSWKTSKIHECSLQADP